MYNILRSSKKINVLKNESNIYLKTKTIRRELQKKLCLLQILFTERLYVAPSLLPTKGKRNEKHNTV